MAQSNDYSHILCAVGTGTMFIGLANSSKIDQRVTGICVLKGMNDLMPQFRRYFKDAQTKTRCNIRYDFHAGRYARRNNELINFMNQLYLLTGIPTDFVYTGKLFYALRGLLANNYFAPGSKLLLIHSGGLQGNYSLPSGTLNF